MDVESSRNLVSNRDTSADERNVSTNHDHNKCRCCLDKLLLEDDFDHLARLLHSNIWQRFCLVEDDCMVEVPGDHVEQESHTPISQRFLDHVDQVSFLGNSETLLPTSSSDTLYETEISFQPANSTVLEHHSGSQNSVAKNPGKISLVDSSILLLPWFVFSATFAGCSKLLQYLLSDCEKRFRLESITSNVNCDVSSKTVQEVTCIEPTLKKAKNGRWTFDAPPELYDKSSLPSLHRACQLVNRRTACEFPICDTWIHETVNLMVSPLHLACWRHDFTTISMLLQHGADPNGLALEQVPDQLRNELIHTDSTDTTQERFVKLCDKFWFYRDKGLSPLHFIALGLRSPPRYSFVKGCEVGIIHDTCSLFQQFNNLNSSCSDNSLPCSALYKHSTLVDYSKFVCVTQTSGQSSLDKNEQTAIKCDLIVNCLNVLLHAGAKPNLGQSQTLREAYVLDMFLQPPTNVYYAPFAARDNQTPEALRLHDLELNASQVVAACNLLLRHDAQLSPKFLAAYMWQPEPLDCFHLGNSDNGWQLVRCLILLGMFNDSFLYDQGHVPEPGLTSISMFTSICINRFIYDVIELSIPASLTNLILKWCSLNTLHNIIRAAKMIAEVSELDYSEKFSEFSDTVISQQMRSLKHSCFYIILSSVQFRFSTIWSLPLPVPLKKELNDLHV